MTPYPTSVLPDPLDYVRNRIHEGEVCKGFDFGSSLSIV
jgi:hypothetical protein